MAIRFEEAFGGSAEMWLGMQAAYDLAQARMRREGTTLSRLASSIM
jgi:plasmid maintenance system antidote protein VapI